MAVVGAGFAGLATALCLAQRGVGVAVFEASQLGAGASGRSGGLVLEDTSAGELPGVDGCIDALASVVATENIECALSLPGCWELVHAEEGIWCDGDRALAIDQTIRGGSLDPAALVNGLADAVERAGGRIFEGSTVVAVEPGALQVGQHRIAADSVCLALNAYTQNLVRVEDEFGAALTLALLTEPLGASGIEAIGLRGGEVFYTIDLPYLWGRAVGDRLLAGGGLAFDPDGRLDRIDVAAGEAGARLDGLEGRIRALHPALAEASFACRWGGPVAFRRDRLPILARTAPGVIVTGAYAGHGVALSFRIAELIADAITQNRELPEWGAVTLAP